MKMSVLRQNLGKTNKSRAHGTRLVHPIHPKARDMCSLLRNPPKLHTLKLRSVSSSMPSQLVCVAEIKLSLLPRIVGVLLMVRRGTVRARQSRPTYGGALG